MKGSKKPAQPEKATNKGSPTSLKSSPMFKGRQSVKVKYGVSDDGEPPLASSPSPGPASFRKPTPPPRHTKVANSPAKGKPVPTTTSGQGPANRAKAGPNKSSTCVPNNQQRHQQTLLPRKGECEVCRQPCRSHCAGCKRVFYCSKQHQQADWSKHKLTCRPFSIPTQYSSGFHLRPPGAVASSSASFSGNNLSCSATIAVPSVSPELQFMISTKSIAAGTVLFTEKPLLVVANVFAESATDGDDPSIWCCSCLKTIPSPKDKVNNNNSSSSRGSTFCPACDVPLCAECVQDVGNVDKAGLSAKFHGGQGHSPEECALICDLCQKTPELLSFTNDGKYAADFMKDLCILRVLMFRTACPWRWESLIALRNSPRYHACCKHNLGNIKDWLANAAEYPLASYYLKNICKEKNILLGDIVKIVAVFCEVSARNSGLLVLYENLSWLAHACTATAEQYFRPTPLQPSDSSGSHQSNLEIIVKAVNTVEEGSKITMNYLTNFEGGRSALALKLFQSKGHYCCDTECACYHPRSFDKTLGIRCDLVFSNHTCSGILSPRLDGPNPEKPNLGLGMFMKSKKWECDKCKKSEKYESLHTKILEIAQDLTGTCDRLCNSTGGLGKGQQSFLQLQNKLLSSLSDQHWMVWKAKLRMLKSWTTSIGYGSAMLRLAVSQPSVSPQTTAVKAGIIYAIKQKVDMYGNGIYSNAKTKGKTGILELFAKRHGQLSPKRGYLLFDAFYANLILLVEDYKKELPLVPGQSDLKRGQVAQENCKKLVILRKLLEETVASLKVTEGTTLNHASAKSYQIAKESLEVLSKVCSKVEQRPTLILGYLNELLELYACHDANFLRSCLRQSQAKSDPFREGFVEQDCLDFEVESGNLGVGASLVFGAAKAGPSSEGVSKSSSSSYTFGDSSGTSHRFGFSSFGSPSFGTSDADSCSDIDDDDDDNPFVYSRASSFKAGKNSTSYNKRNGNSKGASTRNKMEGDDDDWSSYFWFSSDDENPLDDEFDLGFTTSPRSAFGGDLFNEQELEDLAEWATIQFMMGKMKM